MKMPGGGVTREESINGAASSQIMRRWMVRGRRSCEKGWQWRVGGDRGADADGRERCGGWGKDVTEIENVLRQVVGRWRGRRAGKQNELVMKDGQAEQTGGARITETSWRTKACVCVRTSG